MGNRALYCNTTGCNNTAMGICAGVNLTSGCNNIFLGASAQPQTATSCNQVVIGTSSYTSQYAPSATWTALSDQRDKTNITDIPVGLQFIREVRPVKFNWKLRDSDKTHPRWNMPDSGFIAQDLLALAKKYDVLDYLKIATDENPDKIHADPGKLLPVVIKAIQELADENDSLNARITALENKLNK
jgi:hypothetical protein